MKKWYCLLFDHPRGPFTDADMRYMAHRRQITPDTPVAGDWIPENPLDWKRLGDTELGGWVFPSVSEAAEAAGLEVAPMWRRAMASLLDALTLLVPLFLSFFSDTISKWVPLPELGAPIAIWIIADCVIVAVDAVMLMVWGQTIGKRIFSIRVVNTDGGWAAPWLIVMRGIPYLSLAFLCLLFGYPMVFGIAALSTFVVDSLMVLRSDSRALHDVVSSTMVVIKH